MTSKADNQRLKLACPAFAQVDYLKVNLLIA
jgi:hypothetical protein